jgi:histidyl-tRNA synthetase
MKPQTLKGFRDFLPKDMKIRLEVFKIFRTVFEQFGYEPLETPTLEYDEILTGKYGEEGEQLMYRFVDHGDRKVAMRYDLTVPASRVYAQYREQLPRPFKRYQIQPVWRADNTQKGRFREFYQCDADVFGLQSPLVEAEFIQMIDILITKLQLGTFITRINNRKITNGLVKYLGASQEQFIPIVVAIDKLEKIGAEGVHNELTKRQISEVISRKLLSFISEISPLSSTDALKKMKDILHEESEALEGIHELENIFSYLEQAGVPAQNYTYDVSIVRGLSYYTGPVWETTVIDGGVGSVTGCGRYDKLIGQIIGTNDVIPAAGGSFGIERIIEVLSASTSTITSQSATKIFVTIFQSDLRNSSFQIARTLREKGISAELWLDPNTKLEKQLKYANSKEIPYVIICGPDEAPNNMLVIKNMKEKTQKTISLEQLIEQFSDIPM